MCVGLPLCPPGPREAALVEMLHSQQVYIHQLLGQLAAADPDGVMLESESVTPEPMPVPEEDKALSSLPEQGDHGADATERDRLRKPRPSTDV